MTTRTAERRVELFVRSLSPEPARRPPDGHLDRLRDLAASDETVDLSVTVWGREVGLSTVASRTDAGRFVLERVGAFRRWADERGVSLEPFFETRAVGPGLAGEGYTALVLPVCCLAEYENGELVHVAPFATDSAVYSVADRIRRLEARSHPEVDVSVAIHGDHPAVGASGPLHDDSTSGGPPEEDRKPGEQKPGDDRRRDRAGESVAREGTESRDGTEPRLAPSRGR